MNSLIARILVITLGLTAAPWDVYAKSKKGGKSGPREKIISREGRSKVSKDKTKVDFDDAEIGGVRKTPMASMLNNTKAKKEYDMVPIRTDWKPEMVQSASSLDAGRN